MAAAAYGLYAAGLDPLRDRTINLFAAGNLYGGFLSFFTILEHLGAPQLPMALVENTETVAQIIVNFGATALLGPPSYILRLFREQEDLLKKYRGMTKVFYGGDHMTRAQVDFLKNEFGIPVVRSAIYGSNDAGPLGYQCPYCAGGEHHLLSSIQDLEIVHLEEDRPVERGASGRLIFSPKRRYGQRIERYEIGDIGRWIDTSCPCGRKEPRFVLEGRTGDVFKAGGPFFNYRNFVNILTDRFDYAGNVQILLANRGIQTLLLLRLEKDFLERHPGARQTLIYDYAELKFCLEQGLNLLFEVEGISEDEFSRVPQTGKIKHIIDQRME
jgi:phenylacetate-coenzyme A ligase PaaK-like adenylate-forming protein